jgi:hypothetical protein
VRFAGDAGVLVAFQGLLGQTVADFPIVTR